MAKPLLGGFLLLLLLACTGGGASPPREGARPAAPTSPPAAPSGPAPTPAAAVPEPATVQVGIIGSIGDSAFLIGMEKGYYAEQGITLETVPFDSGARMIQPLSAGQLDAAQGAINAGLLNAVARGVGIKAVASNGSSPPGHGNISFVLRSDLVDQVRGPADLRGRKVGLAARGFTLEVELAELLQRGGLTLDDVELTQLGLADQVTALGNRSIDLALITEPHSTRSVIEGFGQVWLRSDELIPDHMTGVIIYSPQFAARTDVARRFMVAALKAFRLYNDAFFKNIAAAREEVIPIYIKHTPVKDRALYDRMVFQEFEPNGRINRESIEHDQAYFLAMGQQAAEVDLDRVIDQSFADYTVQQLGLYQR
jgi:NitT/TauT family transport system substrate-binding protein